MPNNKKTILISGSLAYDRIMDFNDVFSNYIMPDKIHNLNISFQVNGLQENFGGTAGNIAYSLSLLKERPVILATAGKDFTEYKKWLVKNKIDVSQIKMSQKNPTACAYLITDRKDNQICGFNPGAMLEASKPLPKKYLSKNTLAIISPGNKQDMVNYARLYKKNKTKYIFDPGQQITNLSVSELKTCIIGADMLIGNDYEIALIRKRLNWTQKQLISKVNTLIITLGNKGSIIFNDNKKIKIAPVKIKKIVDPTGAGDAYRAGLIKGLVNNWSLKKCGELGSLVATYAVKKYGTQNHKFNINS